MTQDPITTARHRVIQAAKALQHPNYGGSTSEYEEALSELETAVTALILIVKGQTADPPTLGR